MGIGVQGLLPESSPSSLLASSPAIPSARCSGIIPRLFTSTCPTTQHQGLRDSKSYYYPSSTHTLEAYQLNKAWISSSEPSKKMSKIYLADSYMK